MSKELRTVSGMRPTGPLHLGHYFGVLKNWVELQYTEEAYAVQRRTPSIL